MNNKKRNQLIGFIALVLLALLIAPYIMTDKPRQVESTIPLLPSSDMADEDITAIDEANDIEIAEQLNPNAVLNEPTQVEHTDPVVELPQTNQTTNTNTASQPATKNYVIQLVALKNQQKIEELVALLKLNNYDAYTVPQSPNPGEIIRLFVGPYLTKEQAEMVIIDLEHLTKLKGFVTTK